MNPIKIRLVFTWFLLKKKKKSSNRLEPVVKSKSDELYEDLKQKIPTAWSAVCFKRTSAADM